MVATYPKIIQLLATRKEIVESVAVTVRMKWQGYGFFNFCSNDKKPKRLYQLETKKKLFLVHVLDSPQFYLCCLQPPIIVKGNNVSFPPGII
jgi:hypothetical protein